LANPLDVAEEFASLDVLSRGRTIFGPGLGYRPYEYEALGLPFHERGRLMSECLEIVQLAWEEEQFSYHGKFFQIDDVAVTPRPFQQPRPPIWIGANSDAGMRRAARLADGWIVGFADRLPKLIPRLAIYRDEAARHNRSATVCLMRMVGIAQTREEVEQQWLPAVLQTLRSYARVDAPAERNDATAGKLRGAQSGAMGIGELGTDLFVAGSPDDCIAAVRRCIDDTGCDHLMASFAGPDSAAAMELFGREVIPAFA
jgi:alkanesulfonate monooxygenase SsuD/methylene tetrahydromethanopterin reductase-like flavin-dependent oxidoreductase (luciferase family)